MAKISGKETKPEILVRKFIFANGFRFRKNAKNIIGKPDIVLPKYRKVIFVHGCFWHGHNCSKAKLPTSNTLFWEQKIAKNILRDSATQSKLKELGWNVIIIWQCEIKNKLVSEKRLHQLITEITS